MADIHDGPQFTFCHGLSALRCFDTHKAEYQHGKVIDDEDDRSQHFHQKPDDIAESQGNFLCAQGCHGFRGNLTEDQDQHCQNSGCDSGTGVAEDTEGKCCSQGRCRQVDNTYDEILDIFREDRFTRLPVYEETTDDVIGILNIKDLLLCDREHFSVRELMREPYFTYEHKHTADLLVEMRNSSINIAIVLDEYGTTAGLLTLEDLIEEIVGEIRDEYDYDEEDPIQKISDHEYLVEGSMNLADFSDELNLHLESDDYDSIGGYMIGLLDHLPKIRESITTPDGIFLQVRTKNKHRIEKIYVRLPETSAESETTEQSV